MHYHGGGSGLLQLGEMVGELGELRHLEVVEDGSRGLGLAGISPVKRCTQLRVINTRVGACPVPVDGEIIGVPGRSFTIPAYPRTSGDGEIPTPDEPTIRTQAFDVSRVCYCHVELPRGGGVASRG